MPRTQKTPTPDLEARVAALEKALSIVLVHLPAAFWEAQGPSDPRTKRLLHELEDRLSAASDLARVLLPESSHDEALAEWGELPADARKRSELTRKRMFDHLTATGEM